MSDGALFAIETWNLGWRKGPDDGEDLCLHGTVRVRAGDAVAQDDCCVSACALYLLRSLRAGRVPGGGSETEQGKMLPCCGFAMYAADEALSAVEIFGCPNGTEIGVSHVGDDVLLTFEDGRRRLVPLSLYRREVLRLAARVEEFYRQARPRALPDDPPERDGYRAFWNEFKRRRDEAVAESGDVR